MQKVTRLAMLLSFGLIILSCLQAQIKVFKENGITVVQNPAEPLDKKVKELKLIEEVCFGNEIDENYMISNQRFVIDSKQNFFVENYKKNKINKYDKNGKFLLAFGSKGDGPGEFRDINGLNVDSENRLLLYDSDGARIIIYDSNGKYLSHFKTSKIKIDLAPHENILLDNSNIILHSSEMFNEQQKKKISYFSLNQSGIFSEKLFEFEYPILTATDKIGARTLYDFFNTAFFLTPNKQVYNFSYNYEFIISDRLVKNEIRVEREFTPKKRDSKSIESMEKKFGSALKFQQYIIKIICIDKEIWVISQENKNRFDIFDFEGKFIRQYIFPEDFTYAHWTFDKIENKINCYKIIENDKGTTQLIRYRVEIK